MDDPLKKESRSVSRKPLPRLNTTPNSQFFACKKWYTTAKGEKIYRYNIELRTRLRNLPSWQTISESCTFNTSELTGRNARVREQ